MVNIPEKDQGWMVNIPEKDQVWLGGAWLAGPRCSLPASQVSLLFPQQRGSVTGLPDVALGIPPNLCVTGPRPWERAISARVPRSLRHPTSPPTRGPCISSVLCTDRY